jgi:hypothetical protein
MFVMLQLRKASEDVRRVFPNSVQLIRVGILMGLMIPRHLKILAAHSL